MSYCEDDSHIPKNLVPLYVDVMCYGCGRRVALSNTVQKDGRNYCHVRCNPYSGMTLEELAKPLIDLKEGD